MVEKNESNSERERRWRAEEVAQKQADELTKRANAMKKVASKGKK